MRKRLKEHLVLDYLMAFPLPMRAELQGSYAGLCQVQDNGKDVFILVDSRGALESLNSRNAVYEGIVLSCKNIISRRINVQFHWIPSRVGIYPNETADMLAKCATAKDEIDVPSHLSMRQIRTLIKCEQEEMNKFWMMNEHENSNAFRHYVIVSNVIYGGKNGTTRNDIVQMRLRLGYKYLWQYGTVSTIEERRCRVCGVEDGHTLGHYGLRCGGPVPIAIIQLMT